MNQENRQKVLDYCSQHDTYPLYFYEYESDKEEFNPEKYSIDDMVRRVFELSKRYPSFNSNTGEYESSANRWRSVLDIWRHIIFFYPTVEIFDVMHSLYKLREECSGQYCTDVNRRTFKSKGGSVLYANLQYAQQMRSYCGRTTDEFDLVWEDWENI